MPAGFPPGPGVPSPGVPFIPTTSGKAVASLVCGLFAWILPAAIAAIVTGHLALSEIKKSFGRLTGQGMAIAGLVLGYAGIAFIPLILIIAAIAIPNLLRARLAANESSAAAGVRTLVTAEVSYSSSHPDTGVTCNLQDLTDQIGPALAGGVKSGYRFHVQDCEPETPGGPNVKYKVVAYPLSKGQTGTKAFCSDESAVVKFSVDGSAQTCVDVGEVLR